MVPVCQMVSRVTRNGPDTFSDASGTETAAVDDQDIDDFYQWAVVHPAVKFSDILICEEECDNAAMDKRIARISPSSNPHFGQTSSEYVGGDTYYARLCLLHPAGVENLLERRDGYVDNQGLNHWHTVSWDPGVADSRVLLVCYDCLCLVALLRTVMSLPRDWVEVFVWTGHDTGYCRSSGWELWYLPRMFPPCVVDRLADYLTEIKVPAWSFVLSGDMDNSTRRCVCIRGTPLGVFSAGRISFTLIGCRACVGCSVSCSDWPCLDCAVDFSPGGVWISYIRPGLEDGSLIDATPVTGSLVSSTLFSCRDVYCTAGFSSYWTFCGTDSVLLAGYHYQVFLRQITEHWNMTANGASVVDDRAGITFGVELYVPWDAPKAVVDVSSAGVVPLRHIPDVIGLVGRREGAAESRVVQGRSL